ncbi:MAG: hypothetical protein PR2021_0460 [Candidatus Phytoplasma pruni]|nr:MAG: hypothetical protein PR2021_0460 [Candidatus Phytoplasma pruni]
MNEQEIVNLLKKEKKEKKKNEQAILSALNIYKQLNVHEQLYKTKQKKSPKSTKIYTDIDSNGCADIIYVEKPKKKQLKLKVNNCEGILAKPKDIKKNKKHQQIKYALVNAELKEPNE